MNARCVCTFVTSLALATLPTQLVAGWTVTYLNPTGASDSWGHGIGNGQQVGMIQQAANPYEYHASLWTGTASSWADLDFGWGHSRAWNVSGGQQVGFASSIQATGGHAHAIVWHGSAASHVDLHPPGYTSSEALGVSGAQEVGYALDANGQLHASLWTGTAASWIDLSPAGCTYSAAKDVHDGQQVGTVRSTATGGQMHASLWTGTAASWVDLNPAGCSESTAAAVWGGQQAGVADGARTGYSSHACLWNGNPESWLDLNPSGYGYSGIGSASGGYQAGDASFDSTGYVARAGLWHGTASSFVDLHSFLPAQYTKSHADDIEVSGNDVWAVGYAIRKDGNSDRYDAVLWHNVIPEPSALLALLSGSAAWTLLRLRRRH